MMIVWDKVKDISYLRTLVLLSILFGGLAVIWFQLDERLYVLEKPQALMRAASLVLLIVAAFTRPKMISLKALRLTCIFCGFFLFWAIKKLFFYPIRSVYKVTGSSIDIYKGVPSLALRDPQAPYVLLVGAVFFYILLYLYLKVDSVEQKYDGG